MWMSRILITIANVALISRRFASGYQTVEPRRFVIDKRNLKDIVPATIPLVLRLGTGALISGYTIGIEPLKEEDSEKYTFISALGYKIKEGPSQPFKARPKKYLEIYEFEGCPFCKKVREAISVLDLDVIYYPCPKGGPTFRPKVLQTGGKAQFPYLVDPNTGTEMYESADIINYLYDTYGNDVTPPGTLTNSFLTTLFLSLSSIFRLGKGSKFEENKFNNKKDKPLVFWAYEGSPFCKVVREKLVEYEIPHIQRTVPRGSEKRNELYKATGRFQIPYLEDPNTGIKLFESADITAYLIDKYGF